MLSQLKPLWTLLKQVAQSWVDDYAPSMGAALAYYTTFSLAPLLLIAISVAGLVFGEEAARGEIVDQLRNLMGEQSAAAIQELLVSVHKPAQGIAATVLGVVLLVVGATTVFGELQNALNRIWRAPAKSGKTGWIGMLQERLLSFGMIMAIGFLLIVSLLISAVMATTERWIEPIFGDWYVVAAISNALASFVLVSTMFALIYKVMPRAHVEWKDVWIGAVVTALLFTLGKYLIGLYVGQSGVASAFGAAGSLVVILVWVYYSAQIFLIGAEFTWCYANAFGSLKKKPARPPLAAKPTPVR